MHTASRWFLSLFLLACALPAQIVRVANFSGAPYAGWKRTTIDVAPPRLVGRVGDVLYVVGRQVGLDVAVADQTRTPSAHDAANHGIPPWDSGNSQAHTPITQGASVKCRIRQEMRHRLFVRTSSGPLVAQTSHSL